jgi:[acyl-carrier-protein] S-malonyltransferase
MTDTYPNVLLCPGQGAQHVGMAKAWHDASPEARAIFEQADDILGIALSTLCFDGPEDELNRTDVAQPAIYTASVASHAAMQAAGALPAPDLTAGLSLGEFTALHLAGAFSFADGLRLVRLRGQAMQDAAEASDSTMVALIGADEDQAGELCDTARGDGVLVPANFNCPGQIVISGTTDACTRALDVASDMGLRATALTVAGAFHSPVMQPAADRLAEALEQVDWQPPSVPVLSNVTAQPHEADPASIRQRLVEQLTHPVRWGQSMQWAISRGGATFHELAPGKVLAGLMRRIDRKTPVTPHPEP